MMNILISNTSGKPIYEQIMEQIKAMIVNGTLSSSDALPSIRVLAKELRISVITTKRAYEDLETEGYIVTIPGKGSFVSDCNQELLKEEQLRKIEAYLQQAIDTATQAGISIEELITIIHTLEEE